jgi:predicted outer membrane repeat protein
VPDVPAAPSSTPLRLHAARAAAVASSGLLVGIGVTAATPALAATEADCTVANTLDAASDTELDLQALLGADTAIVCFSGTFPLTTPLAFDHNLTLFGLTAAELDGNDLTGLLVGSGTASLTVQNITFTDGSATEGGAIASDGNLLVENSVFRGNTASNHGGAIFNAGGGYDVQIVDSVFTGNTATNGGGAVYGSGVSIVESTFTENAAVGGGAVYGFGVFSAESTFTANEAEVGGAVFGGQYNASAGSTFIGNEAEVVGGAMVDYGVSQVINSTFLENVAGEVGGAILTTSGQIALSTFIENRANSGVGVDASEAIMAEGDGDTVAVLGNIFAGTRANAQLGSFSAGAYSDGGGNVFSTTQTAESALGTPDPSTQFGRSLASIVGTAPSAQDNGGSAPTIALVAGSPAIDAVPEGDFEDFFGPVSALSPANDRFAEAVDDLQAAITDATVDQRNVERTGLLDAGAFEYGDAELAATGADSGVTAWLAGAAALLLGLGVTVIALARRSRRR